MSRLLLRVVRENRTEEDVTCSADSSVLSDFRTSDGDPLALMRGDMLYVRVREIPGGRMQWFRLAPPSEPPPPLDLDADVPL